MYTILGNVEEVCNELPVVKKWIKTIHKKFLKKEINMDEIEITFSYGFFVPKGDKEGFYQNQYNMKFDERLSLEMSKLRVDVFIKVGKFSLINRLDNGVVPSSITKIVNELTKVKMTLEGEYNQNQEVIDSIPEIDTSIVSFRILKEGEDTDTVEDSQFDIDEILDKINNSGVQSLTTDEREFLDKISKGF